MNRKQRRQAAKTAKRLPAASSQAIDLERTLAVAVQHQQAGRLEAAESLYAQILKVKPKHADALHLSGVLAHQRGQNERAAQLIKKAITLSGMEPLYHYHLGEVYRLLGRFEPAITSYRHALELQPELADAHYNLANALFELNDFEQAEAAFRQALSLAPFDAEIHNNLGNAVAAQNCPDEAMQHYREALLNQPGYVEAYVNLADTLTKQGRLDEAVDNYHKARELMPDLPEVHRGLGRALKAQGRLEEALSSYRQATALQPESTAVTFDLGDCLLKLERWTEAVDCFRKLTNKTNALAFAKLGYALDKLGHTQEALDKFQSALKIDPNLAEAHFYRGACLQNQGYFEEAVRCHERALAIRPDLTEAVYSLASINQFKAGDEDILRLTRLLQGQLGADARINISFALAKLYEGRNRMDDAFKYYRAANQLKAELMPFNPEGHRDYISRLIETFTSDFFAQRKDFGVVSELPIFIIGMPRSGTTLVEQIVSSHPQAFGAGELDAIRLMVRQLPEQTSMPFPACATALDRDSVKALAQGYLKNLQGLAPQATRISDKMLGNFLRLGLIALLFPNARVIHCRRDPLDTCWSCYCQHFAHGLRFTYDLQHMGIAYREYERLMAHWRQALPLSMLDVQYEDLVAEQEQVSRQLIEFCDLPWDQRCLNFYQQERQVQTASFWQVRQPMYASSVGRWRAYAKHLAPLTAVFGQERLAS